MNRDFAVYCPACLADHIDGVNAPVSVVRIGDAGFLACRHVALVGQGDATEER